MRDLVEARKNKLQNDVAGFYKTQNYLLQIEFLQKILGHCRYLRICPSEVISTASKPESSLPPEALACPYCNYVTTHGETGIKAHIGRKHKGKPIQYLRK